VTFPHLSSGVARDFPKDGYIAFVNHDKSFPLPDRSLLELHAAVAEILHASGIGDHIDEVMRERAETKCLSEDGSTDVERLLWIV
jgi:hypothetical protein